MRLWDYAICISTKGLVSPLIRRSVSNYFRQMVIFEVKDFSNDAFYIDTMTEKQGRHNQTEFRH